MNVPLNSNFADKFSGWGMNFEGKYDLTPYWSIGAFLNFHTNHRYVGVSGFSWLVSFLLSV